MTESRCLGATAPDVPILRLPMPGHPLRPCGTRAQTPSVAEDACVFVDDASRGWYRWLLGHHLAFCVWRLLGDHLSRRGAANDGEAQAAELYDVYSALLLYAGSCSRQTYATVIRPRMAAAHPAFNGTWARDYERVHGLLRDAPPVPGGRLSAAVKFNRLVHMTVAQRLVPDGPSLLRAAGRHAYAENTEEERDLLDRFFLTARAPVCQHEFDAQLGARLAAMRRDIARSPVEISYDRDDVTAFQHKIAQLPEGTFR